MSKRSVGEQEWYRISAWLLFSVLMGSEPFLPPALVVQEQEEVLPFFERLHTLASACAHCSETLRKPLTLALMSSMC